jgi:serine/threonine protein kinase
MLTGTNGFVKVVDFGFAKPVPYMNKGKELQYRTFTLCGTPDYMAPEVVLTQGHDSAADYWAYGIVLYELLCGCTPFSGRNQQRTFEKIVHSQKYLQFPQKFDSHGRTLIRRLLHHNASLRIGCLQHGCQDVKEHAFFLTQGLDFEKLIAKDMDVSFRPSEEDVKIQGSTKSYPPFDAAAEMRLPEDPAFEEYFAGLSNTCHEEEEQD